MPNTDSMFPEAMSNADSPVPESGELTRKVFVDFDQTPEGRRVLGLDAPEETAPPKHWWEKIGSKPAESDIDTANSVERPPASESIWTYSDEGEPAIEDESAALAPIVAEEQEADASAAAQQEEEVASSDAPQQEEVVLPARKSNAGTYAVIACIVLLLALTVLGSMLNVGDHLADAHPALGWVFYGILVLLVIVGIVVPLVKIAKRPVFSLYQLRDEKGHAKRRRCQMLVDNLVANADLTDEEVIEVRGFLQKGDEADDLLIEFFNEHCTPKIDRETNRAATTAFFIAAVARSPLISTVTMLSLCLDLVRSIVELCGFRPTNLGLARLYTRVMLSALIIGGIEDSDLTDILGQLMGGGAGARAGGIVLGATAEGLVSAFLVFRVGVITKRWLTAADGPERMSSIRRTSYREALSLMRTSGFMQTVSDAVKETTESVASSAVRSMKNRAKSTMEAAKSAFYYSWGVDEPQS